MAAPIDGGAQAWGQSSLQRAGILVAIILATSLVVIFCLHNDRWVGAVLAIFGGVYVAWRRVVFPLAMADAASEQGSLIRDEAAETAAAA
mmetsp:Transcript_87694/g.196354  ORF Transcript_87694/g.196354 Transcript_87694/m.196354 type:complete len:90 (+) Transcript_87694:96-365(+)